MNKKNPTATSQAIEWPRADPAELQKFDPATKRCEMNCGPHAKDPRDAKERKFLCDECSNVTSLASTCDALHPGYVVFKLDGSELSEFPDCTACGGSGHIEDQRARAAEKTAGYRVAGMQQPTVTNGYKLVPLEPTQAMTQAGQDAGKNCAWSYAACYRAMLAAAPHITQPPATSVPQQSLADALHYPGCWDTTAYPSLSDALSAAHGYFKCSECAPAAPPVPLPVEPQLVYPPTMTPTLKHVLGFPNFRTGPIAHVFQAAGFAIPTKCEAEQAFVLDRMIRAVLTHGEGWADAFTADLRAQHAIAAEIKGATRPAAAQQAVTEGGAA